MSGITWKLELCWYVLTEFMPAAAMTLFIFVAMRSIELTIYSYGTFW